MGRVPPASDRRQEAWEREEKVNWPSCGGRGAQKLTFSFLDVGKKEGEEGPRI